MSPHARRYHLLVAAAHGAVATVGAAGAAALGATEWTVGQTLAAATAAAAGVALAVVTAAPVAAAAPGRGRAPPCRCETTHAAYGLYLVAAVASLAGAAALCFVGAVLLSMTSATSDPTYVLADDRNLPAGVTALAWALVVGRAVSAALTLPNTCVAWRLLPAKAAGGGVGEEAADAEAAH